MHPKILTQSLVYKSIYVMAAASVSNGSGFEVLTGDNYERWSVLMENYLRGEGLWNNIISNDDIIEDGDDDVIEDYQNDEDWKRNAKALFAIQLSCGPNYFKWISKMKHAREAWTCLRKLDRPCLDGISLHTDIGRSGLLKDAERGHWFDMKIKIREDRNAIFECDSSGKTALHVAVIAGHEDVVEKLVNRLQGEEERLLTMKDKDGYTALALVALFNGNMRMARCMIEKNRDLLTIKTDDDQIPLLLASAGGHKQLTRYLYSLSTDDVLRDQSYGTMLFQDCISAKIFDVALLLIERWRPTPIPPDVKDLPCKGYDRMPPLLALANMPSVFPSGCRLKWWQRAIYKVLTLPCQDQPNLKIAGFISEAMKYEFQEITTPTALHKWLRQVLMGNLDSVLMEIPVIKELYDTKVNHYLIDQILNYFQVRVFEMDEPGLREASVYEAMLQAAKYGIVEFIESMSLAKPGLLWATGKDKRGVLSHVILNRQEKLKYLFTRREITAQQDVFGNNILHQAAELGPFSNHDHKFGALLQMQKEIRWFKEVENFAHPVCKEATNANGKKPHEVFTESHRELVEAGEKWAKGAASSFTIICTLIITITFAAAFTVPGGNKDTGFPIFLKRTLFEVFTMADTVSLITSSSSVLISINILTSHFTEQDFVTSLPLMLIANLFFLFMSVAAMMVAFCAGITMMLRGYPSLIIATLSLAVLPIYVFVRTPLPLFFRIAKNTIELKGLASILSLPYNVFKFILISPILMSIYLIKKIIGYGAYLYYWHPRHDVIEV